MSRSCSSPNIAPTLIHPNPNLLHERDTVSVERSQLRRQLAARTGSHAQPAVGHHCKHLHPAARAHQQQPPGGVKRRAAWVGADGDALQRSAALARDRRRLGRSLSRTTLGGSGGRLLRGCLRRGCGGRSQRARRERRGSHAPSSGAPPPLTQHADRTARPSRRVQAWAASPPARAPHRSLRRATEGPPRSAARALRLKARGEWGFAEENGVPHSGRTQSMLRPRDRSFDRV